MTPHPPSDRPGDQDGRGAARAASPITYLACPFCGEDDFDLVGLKMHLRRGWCGPFNALSEEHRPTPTGEDGAVPHLTDGGRR